ncbi:DinB family protein [Paenibacillus glycanilyticus]|uniref:DinB family protein n=1 Tax=Paenibacillus glycanilyticus TaxID=126569 RepID=UPI00203D7FC0|nr:DinB family protein [Paenibacillus glycanilyticus]MCM3630722.1 DinB family protein [Paenibacillus glycanilyticus]
MSHEIIRQYEYHIWANKRLFEHLKQLPEEVYAAEVQSVFPSVAAVLEHLYVRDEMWLAAISGEKADLIQLVNRLTEEAKGLTASQLEERYNLVAGRFREFMAGVDDLDKHTSITHPRAGSMTAPISGLIQHVVNHGTYHRGNVTAILRQQGHPGVATDYIYFLYGQFN